MRLNGSVISARHLFQSLKLWKIQLLFHLWLILNELLENILWNHAGKLATLQMYFFFNLQL